MKTNWHQDPKDIKSAVESKNLQGLADDQDHLDYLLAQCGYSDKKLSLEKDY